MQLLPSNVGGFLERFYHCYDGLVRKIEFSFAAKEAIVLLEVQDQESGVNSDWVHLTLTVKNVVEFTFIEDKSTCVVLTDGVKIGFFESKTYIDLCPYTEAPRGVDDFRRSKFLVAGEQCFWSIALVKPAFAGGDTGGDKLAQLPFLQIRQQNEVFNSLTYRQHLSYYGQILAKYSHLYKRHLQHETMQERLQSAEREQMDLLDEQINQWQNQYLRRLPNHLVAYCPYCNTPILQPVDNFCLIGFHPLINLVDFYHGNASVEAPISSRQFCKHVVVATISVNLNDLKPNDLPQWSLSRKWLYMDSSPRVMVWPLLARRTSAVIHALPIGRLDDPEPVHRYTAYFVTYFMDDISNLTTKEMWVPTDLGTPATDGVTYDPDLLKWVEAGRLYWLDPNDPSRLMKGPVDEFPYFDIKPQGRYRIIENGEVEGPHPYSPRFTWQGKAPSHNESFPKTIE